MSPVRIDIVIVNYRCGRLAVDALRSLEPDVAASVGSRVVVVDNDSGDDSVVVLETEIERCGWGAWASVVAAGRNGGFAGERLQTGDVHLRREVDQRPDVQ